MAKRSSLGKILTKSRKPFSEKSLGKGHLNESQRKRVMEGLRVALEKTTSVAASVKMVESFLEGLTEGMHLESIDGPRQSVSSLMTDWITSHLPADQIASITSLGLEVFGDESVAISWLREPNLATDNKPPITILGTQEGFDRVKNLLQRIEYGVLA